MSTGRPCDAYSAVDMCSGVSGVDLNIAAEPAADVAYMYVIGKTTCQAGLVRFQSLQRQEAFATPEESGRPWSSL